MARRRSRLTRKKTAKNLKVAYFFIVLTILLILALVFLGIPIMVKLAALFGEIRGSSQPISKTDQIPPPTPKIFSLPKYTNQARITIKGSSEPKAEITVFINGKKDKEIVAGKEGLFTTQVKLPARKNEITLKAEDEAGNRSQESLKQTIILDQTSPEIEMINPVQEETTLQEDKTKIQGKTEKEAKVYINDHLVITDFNGQFEYKIILSEGENLFKIKVKDPAGNITEKEIKITYEPF